MRILKDYFEILFAVIWFIFLLFCGVSIIVVMGSVGWVARNLFNIGPDYCLWVLIVAGLLYFPAWVQIMGWVDKRTKKMAERDRLERIEKERAEYELRTVHPPKRSS